MKWYRPYGYMYLLPFTIVNYDWLYIKRRPTCSSSTTVVHNVRPAGHIRPATSPDVARDVHQEK